MRTLGTIFKEVGYISGVLICAVVALADQPPTSTNPPAPDFADKNQVSQWMKEAEGLVAQRPKEAATYVEKKLQEYKEWRGKNPNKVEQAEMLMPGLYYELGKAKLAAGNPVEKVSAIFMDAVRTPSAHYLVEQAWVLAWMCDKGMGEEYFTIMASFGQRLSVQDYRTLLFNIVRNIVTERPGAIPQHFSFDHLDPVHAKAEDPIAFAKAIQGILDEVGAKVAGVEAVKDEFLAWCRRKKNLAAFVLQKDIEAADKILEQRGYDKAAEMYQSIVKRSARIEDRAAYELKLCQCLMGMGEYEKVVLLLDALMGKVRPIKELSEQVVPESLIMRGQCFLRMGNVEKAKDSYSSVVKDYPKSTKVPAVRLLISYCKIKMGNIKEAKEELTSLVKDYPDTGSCYQAKLYLEALTRVEKK